MVSAGRHVFALDIETMPDESVIALLPEPEVKTGNTKDPDKIDEKKENKKKAQLENMALNPLYGKICCICAYSPIEQIVYCGLDEYKIVSDVMEDIFNPKIDSSKIIITWGGMYFDIPFIFKRAIILGVNVRTKLSMWTKRYSNYPHADLMQIWSNWSQGYMKLDDVSNILLRENKQEIDFRLFPQLIKTEDGRKQISGYCMNDCRLTWDINSMMENVLY